ncbi:MAG: hypothetical protein QOD03_406, partial [Verrucomicrobiota bacterium]
MDFNEAKLTVQRFQRFFSIGNPQNQQAFFG